MKPETQLGRQLQTFNRFSGVTHLIQAALLFGFKVKTGKQKQQRN